MVAEHKPRRDQREKQQPEERWKPRMSAGLLRCPCAWTRDRDHAAFREGSQSNTVVPRCVALARESKLGVFNQSDVGSHWRIWSQKHG